MAVEEPSYKLEMHEGAHEVRAYPPLIAAETTVSGDRGAAVNAGFRLLAAYIFGGNVQGQSIAMTAPVVQAHERAGRIAGPLTASGKSGTWIVQFIMPAGRTLETLPAPKDSRVRLRLLSPARLAVARFSGLTTDGDLQRETAALEAFMARHGLHAAGAPALARYDPPWTPWFLRRNEIWIPISP